MDTRTAPAPVAQPHQPRRAWLALAGLALAALGLSRDPPPDPLLAYLYALLTDRSLAPLGGGIGAAIGALGLVFALALAFLLGFGLRDAFKRRKAKAAARIFKERRRDAASAAALALMALALFLGLRYGSAYLSDLQDEAAREGTQSEVLAPPAPGSEAVPQEPAYEESAEGSVFFARLTALAFLAGAGALLAARAYRRLRPAEARTEAAAGEQALARGLAVARERLHSGDRDADAIIDCYADMCELFLRGDDERKPQSAALTAREFEALLRSRGAGESQIHELTLLFEKARYSGLACDANDRQRASDALKALELRYLASTAAGADGHTAPDGYAPGTSRPKGGARG